MSKVFYISDHHFFHSNIIRFSNRPFANAGEMNEKMIRAWNSVVDRCDLVIHGGDFGLAPKPVLKNILSRLAGYKVLVRGNHDGTKSRCKDLGFIDVVDYWYQDGVLVNHYPFDKVPAGPLEECDIFLHGHVHDLQLNNPPIKSVNICVERQDYTPKTKEQLMQQLVVVKRSPFIRLIPSGKQLLPSSR